MNVFFVVFAMLHGGLQVSPAQTNPLPTGAARRLVLLAPADNSLFEQANRQSALPASHGAGTGQPRPSVSTRFDERLLATASAQRNFADSAFAATLIEMLPQRLDLTLVSPEETHAALTALHLSPAQAATRNGARQLCARLNADALIAPQITSVEQRDGAAREIVARGQIRFWQSEGANAENSVPHIPLSIAPRPPHPAGRKPRRVSPKTQTRNSKSNIRYQEPPAVSLPQSVEVAGVAISERMPLRLQYARPQSRLLKEAADQAAAFAIHTLLTGETAPFLRSEDRLAVAPLVAPHQADKLIFAPGGRQVLVVKMNIASPNLVAQFATDLLPLRAPASLLRPDATQRVLERLRLSSGSLWKNDHAPDTERARSVCEELGVNYLLLTRITQIELDEDAPDTPEDEREAHVIVAGALVRVGDGIVLWQDRGDVTLTARAAPRRPALGPTGDVALVNQSARFALTDLQRRFRDWRARFLR